MRDLQANVRQYLEIIDNVSRLVRQIKELLNDPSQCVTDRESKFLVGGQLSALGEEFENLAKEMERHEG
jgi:hypothetical protein